MVKYIYKRSANGEGISEMFDEWLPNILQVKNVISVQGIFGLKQHGKTPRHKVVLQLKAVWEHKPEPHLPNHSKASVLFAHHNVQQTP